VAGENPLVDVGLPLSVDVDDGDETGPPAMPDISGVVAQRVRRRLTDSFFKLVGRDWTPQIIDDPSFPVTVLAGGRKLRGWCVRRARVTSHFDSAELALEVMKVEP
jgi:hypothetical protein